MNAILKTKLRFRSPKQHSRLELIDNVILAIKKVVFGNWKSSFDINQCVHGCFLPILVKNQIKSNRYILLNKSLARILI